MNQLETSNDSPSTSGSLSARSLGCFRLETAAVADSTVRAGGDNNEHASPPAVASRTHKTLVSAAGNPFRGRNAQHMKTCQSHRRTLSEDVAQPHHEQTECDNNMTDTSKDDDATSNQSGPAANTTSPRRRGSFPCEPMVKYDTLGSINQADATRVPHLTVDDDDVVNFRSPVARKPVSGSGSSHSHRITTMEPASRPERADDGAADEPSWTDSQFWQYCEVLDVLQQACGSAEGSDIVLSEDRLGQMERMLCSLLPPQMQQ